MSIDCDGQPGSKCSKSTDPYFQPQTAFTQSNGQPLKAEELPFVVVPLASSLWNYRDSGLRGGDLVVMAYRDRYVFGVVGDLGPAQRIGEASYAAAEALGINPNPRSGGVASGVTYVAFPGVRVSPIESKAEAVRVGTAKLAEWLGTTVPAEEPEPPQGGSVAGIAAMIAEAEKTIGWSDQNNTVRTPVHTWYNEKFGNPDPGKYAWDWCDGWITYLAHKTGNQKAVVFGDNGHFAYTVAHAQAFKDRGQWHSDVAGIAPGDIVFFDWNGSNSISAIDHVGLVVKVDSTGIHTIEGNIENAVRRKVRTASAIAGYGRPKYTGGTTPPPAGGGTVAQVKLADAIAKTAAATRVIQDALNKEFGGVVVDGDYGPQTTAAYTRWQQSLGWPGDGVPGAHSLWSLAKKYSFTTDITGTPAGPGGTPTPPPAPEPEPEPQPEPEEPKVTVIFEQVRYGAPVSDSVREVQRALNKFKPPVTVDGDFGPKTKAAYSAWQKSLGFTGSDADGNPGYTSLSRLAAKYGFTLVRQSDVPSTPTPRPDPQPKPPATGTPSINDYLTVPEEAHNYSRVSYGGRTVNVRTREMLKLAAAWANTTLSLTQGSYNKGVSASAGTHDGGGVVDISVNGWSSSKRTAVVVALRKAGFAAWLRTPAQGFSYHIHACAIGDREMASGAKNQVQAYFNGRNGLANNGRDDAPRHWPNWADKYNQ